jgi:hypothetical protein
MRILSLVADMFNLESLQRLCASSLVGQLTVANVIDVFKAVCSQAAPPGNPLSAVPYPCICYCFISSL